MLSCDVVPKFLSQVARDSLVCERALDVVATIRTIPLEQCRIFQQATQARGKFTSLSLAKDEPATRAFDQMRDFTGIRTDDSRPTGHGLDENPPELLFPTRRGA